MKQPKTSPFSVSIAITVYLARPDFTSNEYELVPSRIEEYFSQKLLLSQLCGRCFCNAYMIGGWSTWGIQGLSFLFVSMIKKEILSKSTPGAIMWFFHVKLAGLLSSSLFMSKKKVYTKLSMYFLSQ
jgi:hypothetical protein